MDAGEQTEATKSERHNLTKVLQNAVQEADACDGYALDAEVGGNDQLAVFFRDIRKTYAQVVEQAEEILTSKGVGGPSARVRSRNVPAESDPDPGDTSLDRETAPR